MNNRNTLVLLLYDWAPRCLITFVKAKHLNNPWDLNGLLIDFPVSHCKTDYVGADIDLGGLEPEDPRHDRLIYLGELLGIPVAHLQLEGQRRHFLACVCDYRDRIGLLSDAICVESERGERQENLVDCPDRGGGGLDGLGNIHREVLLHGLINGREWG